jgi:HlyD family secretion protein
VNQLSVHTIGGVIGNGEVLMEIVPRNDELIIEGKIDPRDIDQVQVGADALVRVMAGEQRANPDLNGKVTLVSADLTRDRPAAGTPERAYYTVRVSLAKEEVARLGELKLLPGMQAEIFVQTYPRTPLQYLIKPLKDQMARAFRER